MTKEPQRTNDRGMDACHIGGPMWGGGTYFFTVNLAEQKRTLLVDDIDVLRTVVKKVNNASVSY